MGITGYETRIEDSPKEGQTIELTLYFEKVLEYSMSTREDRLMISIRMRHIASKENIFSKLIREPDI